MKQKLERITPAGLVVHGSGVTGGMEGPAEVIFAGLIGALLGFIGGLLTGSIARVLTVNARKGIRGGLHWAAYGAGAGAMALALIELFG